MLAQFAARTPPDVFYVDSNVAPDWIKQSVLEPLDPFVAQSKFKTSRVLPVAAQRLQGTGQEDLRLPEGLVAARDADQQPAAQATANVQVPTDLGAADARQPRSSKVPAWRGRSASSPSWDRLLAFVYQNGGSVPERGEDEVDRQHSRGRPGDVNFYVGLIKSGRRGDARRSSASAGAERRSARRRPRSSSRATGSCRSWRGRSRTCAFTNNRMVRGKQDGNLAFTVSYSMARDSKNKPAAWTADPLPRRPAGHEDVDLEGPRAALAERRQARAGPRVVHRRCSGSAPVAVRAGVHEGDGRCEQRAHRRAARGSRPSPAC